MCESSEKNDGKKLDWMYKDASQIVDREEYLLGRKIDKQFETSVLPPDKDQECLPPSIFSRGVTESQVDIARKLQEDPLYLIKKKEIEFREQLMKNPRKMKQLQEMVALQQANAEKIKRKTLKKKKKDDLDALLVKKCNKLFGGDGAKKLCVAMLDSDSETSSTSSSGGSDSRRKKKRRKKDIKNIDKALALKLKKIKGNLDAKQIAKMDLSSSSSSENEKATKSKRKKETSSQRCNEEQNQDMKKKSKKENKKDRKYSSSEDESKDINRHVRRGEREKYSTYRRQSKSKRANKNHEKSSSSEGTDSSDDKRLSSKIKRYQEGDRTKEKINVSTHRSGHKINYDVDKKHSRRSGESKKCQDNESRKRDEASLRHESTKYRKEGLQRGDKNYYLKKEKLSRSSSESSDGNENIKSLKPPRKSRKHKIKVRSTQSDSSSESSSEPAEIQKKSKEDKMSNRKECLTSGSSGSSSDERRKPPKKQYGLVLPTNYVPKKLPKEDTKPKLKKEEQSSKPYRKEIKARLTAEEKERKLKEMMENAKWRDEQRDKNVKAYKEKEQSEKDDYVYNENFLRKQMAIAVSQGTVESRVKANINTIQRSGASMSEHFARRK